MKKISIKFIKPICSIVLIFSVATFTLSYMLSNDLPDTFQVIEGNRLTIAQPLPLEAAYKDSAMSQSTERDTSIAGTKYNVDLKLFGVIPVKQAQVEVVKEMYVIPLGEPFGIKIFTHGVLIVGMTDVDGRNGLVNPAKNAGLKEGDIILAINDTEVNTNEEVAAIIEKCEGKSVTLTIQRNNMKFPVAFTPILSVNESKYKAGIWVRDSSAGIGTLTFYNPNTGITAGLGHGICDVDTGELLPLNTGELVGAEIVNVTKGKSGSPGELRGRFTDTSIGSLLFNGETGVYGRAAKEFTGKDTVAIAMKQDVKEGPAQILSTIDNGTPKLYNCIIEKVHFNDDSLTQNMVIKITDQGLLAQTGGIVQGMSGSPILQSGKLVGAVTHVFVNDSTKGYGIFAENMYYTANSISSGPSQKAS